MTKNGYSQLTPLEWLMPRMYVRQMLAFPSDDRSVVDNMKESLDGVTKEAPYLLSGVIVSESPQGSISLTEPIRHWMTYSPSTIFYRQSTMLL